GPARRSSWPRGGCCSGTRPGRRTPSTSAGPGCRTSSGKARRDGPSRAWTALMPPLVSLDPSDPIVPVIAWAARALTFFNVLVLLWLGLTILLSAERRRLGTWLTGGGLLLGGICSITRASAQAAQPITALSGLDV